MQQYTEADGEHVVRVSASDLARMTWDLPHIGDPGYTRAIARGVRARSASLGVAVVPIGQGSPKHDSDADHLFLGLKGRVVFRVDAHDHELGVMDVLYIPAGRYYEYWNASFQQALFVDVLARVDGWPPSGNYEPIGS